MYNFFSQVEKMAHLLSNVIKYQISYDIEFIITNQFNPIIIIMSIFRPFIIFICIGFFRLDRYEVFYINVFLNIF